MSEAQIEAPDTADNLSIDEFIPKDAVALKVKLEEIVEERKRNTGISFGFVVLNSVVQGKYDRALSELQNVGHGLEEYPDFELSARRYINHSKGLVKAIQVKREISLTPHIGKAKKRELLEKIMHHFYELKKSIINIEKLEKKVRYRDLSSTKLFFLVSFFSAAVVLVCAFFAYEWEQFFDLSYQLIREYAPWLQLAIPY